jgi:hypothetical protein
MRAIWSLTLILCSVSASTHNKILFKCELAELSQTSPYWINNHTIYFKIIISVTPFWQKIKVYVSNVPYNFFQKEKVVLPIGIFPRPIPTSCFYTVYFRGCSNLETMFIPATATESAIKSAADVLDTKVFPGSTWKTKTVILFMPQMLLRMHSI